MNKFQSFLLVLVLFIIAPPFVNDFLLEDILFKGEKFEVTNKAFTIGQLVFFALSIQLALILGFIKLIIKNRSKLFEDLEETNDKDFAEQASLFFIPVMLIYGFSWGIVVFFITHSFSIVNCLLKMTFLSLLWGFLFRYIWRRGELFWLYEEVMEDEDAVDFSELDEENNKERNKSKDDKLNRF